MKLQLPQVTIAAMTSVRLAETAYAMAYSMRGIEFGDAVFISHRRPALLPRNVRFEKTDRICSTKDYSYKVVYELCRYIHTDYVLIVHDDGFVINPDKWDGAFLDYDYIGAPWDIEDLSVRESYRDAEGTLREVGNGVGIRSKRLLDYPSQAGIPWEPDEGDDQWWWHEDTFLSCKHRIELEEAGLRWAPLELAARFSIERPIKVTEGVVPFMFHSFYGLKPDMPLGYRLARKVHRLLFARR